MTSLYIAQLEFLIRILLYAQPRFLGAMAAEIHQLHVYYSDGELIAEQSIHGIKCVIHRPVQIGIYSCDKDEENCPEKYTIFGQNHGLQKREHERKTEKRNKTG